jgi:threonine dehydrogenase-like Zn-dependent dehydrogenase
MVSPRKRMPSDSLMASSAAVSKVVLKPCTSACGAGADSAIELSGAYPALHEALRSVTPGGRVVAAGFYQGEGLGLRLGEEFHHNRVELVCSQIGGVPPSLSTRWNVERLQRTFLDLLGSGRIETVLCDRLVPVDEWNRVMNETMNPDEVFIETDCAQAR